jgi:negative regulator of genetic competence, sporulation and motility
MTEKNKNNSLDDTLDWEYMSDFYNEEEKKVRSFEDIVKECEENSHTLEDATDKTVNNDNLLKVINDVKNVRELSKDGKIINEIAILLGLEEDYVRDILITINSSPEDDSDAAIAYLLMM